MGYSPWGHKELDTTERLHFTSLLLVTKSKKDPVISVQSLSYVRLCDPTDCGPPGSSVPGIFQAKILEWVAIPFSRGSSQPRD